MMHEFKAGDRVRVVKKFTSNPYSSWVPEMDEAIGHEYVLSSVDKTTVYFKELILHDTSRTYWSFPMECIELVDPKYIDGVEVSFEEFIKRTAAPIKMTPKEIYENFGVIVQ